MIDRTTMERRLGAGPGRFRLTLLLAALLACVPQVAGCRIEVEEEGDSDVQGTVERMLTASSAAWNRGEIDGFMDDYVRSPNTTYIGPSGLLVGYARIRERFAPHFEPGAHRDSLRFEDVRVRRLGAVEALATARWILFRAETVTASGPLTLVLRHTSGGWKIIHDHSSSDPAPGPSDEQPS
jgi:ketosteroid isomerase-like protein